MGNRLKGKGVVVTGSGNGIGREIALAFAAEGASVVVNDIGGNREGQGASSRPADEVVAEISRKGGIAVPNHDSVSDFVASENLISTCVSSFGRIDVLVNVAGIVRERMIFNMVESDWDAVMAVHAKGTWNCSRHASIRMREQKWGRIINVTSSTWLGYAGQCSYAAAKGAIVSLTQSVALELGKYGVTCNAVAPTASTRLSFDDAMAVGLKKRLEAGVITKEFYDNAVNLPGPQFLPPIFVYLATDEAANINGKIFRAFGGTIGLYSQPEVVKTIKKDGIWTIDELVETMPGTLAQGF